jgi:hypothetical protein
MPNSDSSGLLPLRRGAWGLSAEGGPRSDGRWELPGRTIEGEGTGCRLPACCCGCSEERASFVDVFPMVGVGDAYAEAVGIAAAACSAGGDSRDFLLIGVADEGAWWSRVWSQSTQVEVVLGRQGYHHCFGRGASCGGAKRSVTRTKVEVRLYAYWGHAAMLRWRAGERE